MMLFKIAWRNLWRNKRRSMIIISSVIVGVVMLLLNDSLNIGMINQMIDNQINSHISHIQIHNQGYNDNKTVKSFVPDYNKAEQALDSSSFVKTYSKRILTFGLLSSANTSAGAALIGVEPDKEKDITNIHNTIIKGRYLSGKKHEIIIGEKMAEKLEVDLGDKVVAVAADVNGAVSNELFRIVGIFQTSSSEFDKTNIYISLGAAQSMLSMGDNITEIAVITDNPENSAAYKKEIVSKLGDSYEVMTYQEVIPLMMMWVDAYKSMIWVYYVIVGVAVLFGIINTMLMSVFERVQEIGVLMSVGMKNGKIFLMIMLEALSLGVLGTIMGFAVGLGLYFYLAAYGIDFSIFSESLASFGVGNVMYPELNVSIIINCFLTIPLVTAIGAIYPARKAIKLQPTEAMRYV